jgi:hypothetical protein
MAVLGLLAVTLAAAGWRAGDRGAAVVALGAGVLFCRGAIGWRRSGYVADRGALGERNGATGRVAWIELSEISTITSGRPAGPALFRYVVLWSKQGPSSWFERFTQSLNSGGKPVAVRALERHVGTLYPLRIDFTMLGEPNSRALLRHLVSHGVEICETYLPPHLRTSAASHRSSLARAG